VKLPKCVPVRDLRCPLCGQMVKWSCHQVGQADCQDGPCVSRTLSPRKEGVASCRWAGTPIIRLPTGDVVAPLPLKMDAVPPWPGHPDYEE